MVKECPRCGALLTFNFAHCDYTCPNCKRSYSEREINLRYGVVYES